MNVLRRITALLLAMLLLTTAALAEERELDPAWKNILLLGSDSRTADEPGRTDTMIILSVNTAEGRISMTSLMRDMWVPLAGTDKWNKINAAHFFGGPEMAVATVNECFGMNIEDYVLVDMYSLTEIIDSLGGVELALTDEEAAYINSQIKESREADYANGLIRKSEMEWEPVEAGESVHLNGEQAMWYARTRAIDSDYQRTDRQRTVLVAMAGKLKEANIFRLIGVATTMMGYMETSLSLGELVDLGLAALEMDLSLVQQMRLPQETTYTSGVMDNGLWTIQLDFEANQEALYQFIYGENE